MTKGSLLELEEWNGVSESLNQDAPGPNPYLGNFRGDFPYPALPVLIPVFPRMEPQGVAGGPPMTRFTIRPAGSVSPGCTPLMRASSASGMEE